MPRITAANLEEHVRRQRERILDAAFDLFRQHGPEGVELTDIASACGLARNSLYKYFPDKDHIMFACVMRNFETVMAANTQTLRGIADPAARIEEWMKQIVRFITGPSHEMVEMLYRVPVMKQELRNTMLQSSAPVIACLRESFSQLLQVSGTDPDLCMAMADGMARAAAHHARRTGDVEGACAQLRSSLYAVLHSKPAFKPIKTNQPVGMAA
ncbi:MAG: TetR/AcrR family transcriptional regulator [Rhodospirillaceae bacterium]|nr:TetR/AcrR family transcriptional regulator [Rhodospirillaceae bacterium]